MTGIPNDAIEAMARALAAGNAIAGHGENDWPVYRGVVRAALRAAEAKGYKLIGREPTEAMQKAALSELDGDYGNHYSAILAAWDAAPGVDKP